MASCVKGLWKWEGELFRFQVGRDPLRLLKSGIGHVKDEDIDENECSRFLLHGDTFSRCLLADMLTR